MYVIINKSTDEVFKSLSLPNIIELLLNDEEVYIISLYSNTMMFPYIIEEYGEYSWESTEYKLPREMVTQFYNQNGDSLKETPIFF